MIVRTAAISCMGRDWEAWYRDRNTPWDKGAPAPPLLELIDRKGAELFGSGPVLVPGCGYGHDVRALARLDLPVLGLDLSETAVCETRRMDSAGQETYEVGDFLDPGWQRGRVFSAIWEHTCFCAIDPSLRDDYARAAACVLPSGGILAGVFYLTPHDPGVIHEGPPFASTIDEIETRLGPWFERVDAWVPDHAYPGREGREWLAVFRRNHAAFA